MPLWALPAVAFVGALVAALSELSSGWRKPVLVAVGIGTAAAGSILSYIDLKGGQSDVERLSGQLTEANTSLDGLKTQSGVLKRNLEETSLRLRESSDALAMRGLEIKSLQEDLDAARKELETFEVPVLRVSSPEISIACNNCDDTVEIVNRGGTIGAVTGVDFISVATLSPNANPRPFLAPEQHQDLGRACPFIVRVSQDGLYQLNYRTFNFQAATEAGGVSYPYGEAVPRDSTVASINLGIMLSSVHSFREDLSRSYSQKRSEKGLSELPDWLVEDCFDLRIRVSMRIEFTSRGGGRDRRTFTYIMTHPHGSWNLHPVGGDLGGMHFGRPSESHPLTTHDGMAEAAQQTRAHKRSRIIDDLASFLMTQHSQ